MLDHQRLVLGARVLEQFRFHLVEPALLDWCFNQGVVDCACGADFCEVMHAAVELPWAVTVYLGALPLPPAPLYHTSVIAL